MVYKPTNLFYESDIAAVAQEQSCFGPLCGFSEHHRALRGLGVVVYGLTTWRVPLGGKLQGHQKYSGVWPQLYLVLHMTAPAVGQGISTHWQWAGDVP